jgi:hypothetical protein
LSEAEASASASGSEVDSDIADDLLTRTQSASRRKSLDPAQLSESKRPAWASSTHLASRDPSPLGRAFSMMSSGSSHPTRRKTIKGKIPKPTKEQLAYIRKVLADVPGLAPSPLPSQLRWAKPPGEKGSETSKATESLAQLKIQSVASESANTDLFECLRQFTAVETLEGENSFACKKCWKLLNPDLVEERKQAKLQRRQSRMSQRSGIPLGEHSSPVKRTIPLIVETNSDLTPSATSSIAERLSPVSPRCPLPSLDTPNSTSTSSLSTGASSTNATSEAVSEQDGEREEAIVERLPPAKPLTTANVEALTADPLSGESTPTASVASVSRDHSPSRGSLSTRQSVASLSTNLSRVKIAVPRHDRHILRKAHKRYLISGDDLPPVLVIHFKRFTQSSKSPMFGTAFSNLKKRDDALSFPQELDMTPFLAPPGKPPGAGPGRRPTRDVPTGSHAPATYRLYGVVEHIGNSTGGHYITYSYSNRYELRRRESFSENGETTEKDNAPTTPRRWFYTSDDVVRACTLEEVLKSKAYMLCVQS